MDVCLFTSRDECQVTDRPDKRNGIESTGPNVFRSDIRNSKVD